MPKIASLTSFTANTQAKAGEVNANFSAIRTNVNTYGAFVDETATISAVWTFSTAPTFGALVTFGNGAAVTGDLTVSGTLTAATVVGVTPAGMVGGTFGAGNYAFPGNVTAAAGTITGQNMVASGGVVRVVRTISSGTAKTVDYALGNSHRHTLTGNGTITLSNGVEGAWYSVEVLQDATGGRVYTFANLLHSNGITPTPTASPNRKDIYALYYDGANFICTGFTGNVASTG